MTRIETTSIESVLQICLHPVDEGDARRKQFIIRVIREIRGCNCFFQVYTVNMRTILIQRQYRLICAGEVMWSAVNFVQKISRCCSSMILPDLGLSLQ